MTDKTDNQFKLNRTSLEIDPDISFEDWDSYGSNIHDVIDSSKWWRADWGNFGESRFGEMANQSSHMILSRPYNWTAQKVPLERRRAELKFSHHRAVASLSPELQTKMLDMAIANHWKVDTLAEAVKETKVAGKASPPAPASRKFTEPPKDDEKKPEAKSDLGDVAAGAAATLFGEPKPAAGLKVVAGTDTEPRPDLTLAVIDAAREAVAFGLITQRLREAMTKFDQAEDTAARNRA